MTELWMRQSIRKVTSLRDAQELDTISQCLGHFKRRLLELGVKSIRPESRSWLRWLTKVNDSIKSRGNVQTEAEDEKNVEWPHTWQLFINQPTP